MAQHRNFGLGKIHIPYNWEYADETEREAEADVTAADVGKFSRQLDDNSIWMLIDHDPVTWTAVGSVEATPSLMDQIWEYIALNNTKPIDTLISSGNYRLFVYFDTHNANSWKAATNASLEVPTGKKLIVLQSFSNNVLRGDTGSRRARFYNSTDAADVIPYNYFFENGFTWVEASPTKMKEVAAGKTVRLEIWNTDTNERASGGTVIAYLADV